MEGGVFPREAVRAVEGIDLRLLFECVEVGVFPREAARVAVGIEEA